jgi:hypothetical protein
LALIASNSAWVVAALSSTGFGFTIGAAARIGLAPVVLELLLNGTTRGDYSTLALRCIVPTHLCPDPACPMAGTSCEASEQTGMRPRSDLPAAVRTRAQATGRWFLASLGGDRHCGLGADVMLRDLVVALQPLPLVVALQPLLKPLDHPVLRDGDDRGRARLHLLADGLQILVLEALVADLAPDSAGTSADECRRDQARREDQPDEAAGDCTALRPLLAAGIGGLLEPDLPVGTAHDHRGFDELDRA